MGVTVQQLERNDGIVIPFQSFQFATPAASAGYFFSSVDATTLSAGDLLGVPSHDGWAPQPISLQIKSTDAAGSTLAVTLELFGEDQFGDHVYETVSATGSETVDTVNVFRRLFRVKVVSIANAAAGDTVDVGIGAAGTGIKYGLPVKVIKNSTSGVGGVRDTVKVVLVNGAVSGSFTADAKASAVTGVSVAANASLTVVMDLKQTPVHG